MQGPDVRGEWVELLGGPLNGLLIRYGAGEAPRESLEFERAGRRWDYRRTAARTAGGAMGFRLSRPG